MNFTSGAEQEENEYDLPILPDPKTGKNYSDNGILPVHHPVSCGCQALLSASFTTQYGWLRKRRNKLHLKLFTWPRVFVVLADRSLYHFTNETSQKPSGCVSLYGFSRVVPADYNIQRENIWAFKLENIQPQVPSLYFAASSEREMENWMTLIREEMISANDRQQVRTDTDHMGTSDGFISNGSTTSSDNDLPASGWDESLNSDQDSDGILPRERPAMPIQANFLSELSQHLAAKETVEPPRHTDDLVPAPYKPHGDLPLQETDNIYLEIEKSLLERPPMPPPDMPPVSPEEEDMSSQLEKYWAQVYFDGNKTEASEIIKRIAEPGVFLVRKSDDGSNVLVVYAASLKKYIIFQKENGSYSLNLSFKQDFPTVIDLLAHYYDHPLPRCDQHLITPYKFLLDL